MTARQIRYTLGSMWLAYFPILVCLGIPAYFSDDGFGITSHIYAFVIMVCYLWMTILHTKLAVKRCRTLPNFSVTRLLLYGALITLVCGALYLNLVPRRIELFSSHTPFDRWWFDRPQTAFGTPGPYLRIFDEPYFDKERPFIGKELFSLPELMSNITLWCLPLFILVSIISPFLPPVEAESRHPSFKGRVVKEID